MTQGTTITAIATPRGAGGVGIIRISGSLAPQIAELWLSKIPRPRYAYRVKVCDAQQQVLDDGLLLYFPAPNSFTGEHVVEFQGHGSPVTLELILQRLYQLGCSPARPGEFSERAFLNDRIALNQAEAIADLIAARSESAARAALRSLDGVFARAVAALQAQLTELRVWIEAAIDFPEEEIDFLSDPKLSTHAQQMEASLQTLLARAQQGAALTDGAHIVILGRPNAGKSSLLNALAGSDRAIVSETAGTTRDLLREQLSLEGIPITLVDTAGLRESHDHVEQEGVRRARAEAQRADQVWFVVDASAADDADLSALAESAPSAVAKLWIWNKADLLNQQPLVDRYREAPRIWLSAREGAGLALLAAQVRTGLGVGEASEGAFSARSRHVTALQNAAQEVTQARAHLSAGSGELAAEHLRLAQQYLSQLTGEYRSDDLLGAIFGSFCIGK